VAGQPGGGGRRSGQRRGEGVDGVAGAGGAGGGEGQ
jgi:hypothetical protein